MSDWKESANKRRDIRQTKVPSIRPPSASKKNTKKWCRGKVGVEHKLVCVSYNEWENQQIGTETSKDWKVLVCSVCDKELDHWWPHPLFPRRRLRPDWVTS